MDVPASSRKTEAQSPTARSRAKGDQHSGRRSGSSRKIDDGLKSESSRKNRKSESVRQSPAGTNPLTNNKPSSAAPTTEKRVAKPTLKPLDILVPAEIGRYTIGDKIGSGTCGVVHMALDNVLRRDVAIN